jgi:hypothetical protein
MSIRLARAAIGMALLHSMSGPAIAQTVAPSASPAAEGVDTSFDAKLEAALEPYKEEWRPCDAAARQLIGNAVERSQASAQGRSKDYARLSKEGDALKKKIGECGKVKAVMVAKMRETGAPDAALDRAWRAFGDSVREPKQQ